MYLAKIKITLKPGVLDPQGATVRQALHDLDYASVEEVRVGKYLELKLSAADAGEAGRAVEEMCDRLLANPVIEQYDLEIVELPDAGEAGPCASE